MPDLTKARFRLLLLSVGETAFTRGYQNLTVTQPIKTFLTFYGTLHLIIMFTKHVTGPWPESVYEYLLSGCRPSFVAPKQKSRCQVLF